MSSGRAIIDGYDVMMLLEDNMDLTKFLRCRQRLLAEEGRLSVRFGELIASQEKGCKIGIRVIK